MTTSQTQFCAMIYSILNGFLIIIYQLDSFLWFHCSSFLTLSNDHRAHRSPASFKLIFQEKSTVLIMKLLNFQSLVFVSAWSRINLKRYYFLTSIGHTPRNFLKKMWGASLMKLLRPISVTSRVPCGALVVIFFPRNYAQKERLIVV